MVQHIRKKHPEFAQLANTIHSPLTTAVVAPAVITADGATAEAVVVRTNTPQKDSLNAENKHLPSTRGDIHTVDKIQTQTTCKILYVWMDK